MTDRWLIILDDGPQRAKAVKWCKGLPKGTRVEFKKPRRSLEQNDRMWAMLNDISEQRRHCEMKLSPEIWKCVFMDAALNIKTTYVPSLDMQGIVPLGYRSSDLSKEEMSDLISFMDAWGAEHGIVFHDVPQ